MPKIESLEQFNKLLIATGNEPAVVQARNGEIEEVSPPLPGEFSQESYKSIEEHQYSPTDGSSSELGNEAFTEASHIEQSPNEDDDILAGINVGMDDFGLGDLDDSINGDDVFEVSDNLTNDEASSDDVNETRIISQDGESLIDDPSLVDIDDTMSETLLPPSSPSDFRFDLDDLLDQDSTAAAVSLDDDPIIKLESDGISELITSDEELAGNLDEELGKGTSETLLEEFGAEHKEPPDELPGEGFLLDDLDFPGSDLDSPFDIDPNVSNVEEGMGVSDQESSLISMVDDAEYKITDDEFSVLQKRLSDLPLNLRIEIAQIILSDKYSTESIQRLITLLITRQPVHTLAQLISRIIGKRVTIPRSYEKMSGASFEYDQDSFVYNFRHTVWPVLRLVLGGTILLVVVLFLAYRYIYQPLLARGLYVQGLDNITLQEYERANRFFDQAYDIWPVNQRFLDYARSFKNERQFALAREKYEALLSENTDPLNRDGILEFSRFSTYDLRDYETSIEYLDRLLTVNVWDYDALLLKADTLLEWGKKFDVAESQDMLFEQARFSYATLIQEYGETDELLFRMLRYFILSENVEDALNLKDLFLIDSNAVLDPHGLADLAGFLLDLDEGGNYLLTEGSDAVSTYLNELRSGDNASGFLEDAKLVLDKAIAINDEIPEIHYNLSRYSRRVDDVAVEMVALRNTREIYSFIKQQRPLDRQEAAREIDSYIREGEVLYRIGEILGAETRYRQAVNLYEQAIAARKVEPSPRFGRVYAALGDIYYYKASDYESARDLYIQARAAMYGSLTENLERFGERQNMAYKLGFINFFQANSINAFDRISETAQQDLLDTAITEFNHAQGAIPTANLNLLYARANTQYLRGNYYDAASLYRILLEELTSQRTGILTLLLEEDDQHLALIDYQIRVNNNLGVTLYRLYEQGGEGASNYFAQSQLFLSRSTELAENLARDSNTGIRADTKPLAYLNLTRILAPEFIGDIQIDPDIRKDLTLSFF